MQKKTLGAVLTVVILILIMASCLPKSNDVVSIAVIEGSLKNQYTVDEVIDFSKTKLQTTTSGGVRKQIAFSSAMVTGFDSSKTAIGKEMIIRFEKIETTFIYDVVNEFEVNTTTRLIATIGNDVEFLFKNSDISDGILAFEFVINLFQTNASTTFVVDGCKVSFGKNVNGIKVVGVSPFNPLSINEKFLAIHLSNLIKNDTIAVNEFSITNIKLADGKKVYQIPNIIIRSN